MEQKFPESIPLEKAATTPPAASEVIYAARKGEVVGAVPVEKWTARPYAKGFQNQPCKQLQKLPYVCNVCTLRRKCKMDRVYYMAQQTDAMTKHRESEARSKPQIQEEEYAR